MIPDTFSLRRAAIAFVFPGQPELRREDILKFYDRVSAEGIDVPQLKQEKSAAILVRASGVGTQANVFAIEVGHHEGNFRFFVHEVWPTRHIDAFKETSDMAWECFKDIWPDSVSGGLILAEAALRLSAVAEGGNATTFLTDECLRISHDALSKLGRQLQGIGLKLVLPLEVSIDAEKSIPLEGATANIQVETLLDDPSRLFFEIIVKWPSVPLPAKIREATGAPERINPEVLRPENYLTQTYEYVTQQMAQFVLHAGKKG